MLLSYTVHEISTHYPRMARTEVKFPPLRGGGGGRERARSSLLSQTTLDLVNFWASLDVKFSEKLTLKLVSKMAKFRQKAKGLVSLIKFFNDFGPFLRFFKKAHLGLNTVKYVGWRFI